MQAVKRFEPEKGFRLATYAMWWIKAAIQEYILRSWSLVKMGVRRIEEPCHQSLRWRRSALCCNCDTADFRRVSESSRQLGDVH
jgi:DNA-directed RNA polymerase sigma subunit (sigma70/sigma32)